MSVRLRGLTAEQIIEDLVLQRQMLQERLQCKLVDYQRKASTEIFRLIAVGGNQELGLLWARRSGKTEMLVDTALTVGVYWIHRLNLDFDIGLINPARNEQSVMVTRERLRERVAELRPYLEPACGIRTELGDGRKTPDFVFIGSTGCECRIRALSADPSAHVKGAGFNLMLLEQVEEMDEQKMKTDIFPMAAGGELQCCRVLGGSPSLEVLNNYYHERTRGLTYPFLVDWKAAAQFRPTYGEFVEQEMSRLGEDSDEFRTQYGCEWIQLRNRLIDRESFLPLAQDYASDLQKTRYAGTDVAKMVDRTVCTVGERDGEQMHILAWLELEGTNYEDQAGLIRAFLSPYKPAKHLVDATGVGDPVVDMLSNSCRGICQTEGFKFTPDSRDHLFKIYERELHQGRVHFPRACADPAQERSRKRFIEEHVDAEREVKANKLNIRAPNRKGAHDDYIISAALAVYAATQGQSSAPDAVYGGGLRLFEGFG